VSHTGPQPAILANKFTFSAFRLTAPPAARDPWPPMTQADIPLSAIDFEAALRKLMNTARSERANVGCVACERCEQSSECTFCVDSKSLTRCHYCSKCESCTESSHCIACRSCRGCKHCVDSDRCTASAYLVRCLDCSSCNYCFGCVGLYKTDFSILNQPYDRTTYFALTARLSRELAIRRA
jgi:hypothetical protein